jgi:hypothetical protein
MYRTPDETPRCACCHSLQLTEPTKFDPSEGYSVVHFRQRQASAGRFAGAEVQFAVTRARICIACGHVMWFLDQRRRTELVERIESLAPIPE